MKLSIISILFVLLLIPAALSNATELSIDEDIIEAPIEAPIQVQSEEEVNEESMPEELPEEVVSEEAVEEKQAEDDKLPAEHGTRSSFSILDAESIVVYDFKGFKSALAGNNGYVNIYLGANINMEALGIDIHSSKKKVMISGKNPVDGSGPHTINEFNSLDPLYTIRITSDSGAKDVIMRDVNVIGRNYYGAVCAFDVTYDVRITFDNVAYNGPQICYNRNGTVRITGNSIIRIVEGNGLSSAHELAEVNALELGGNTVIEHYAPVVSALWLVGSDSYFKVLSGAEITWNETGTYMLYQDNSNPADFIMEDSAKLTINTRNGLFYNTSDIYHQFGSITIGRGASLKITQGPDAATLPIIKVKNGIRVLEDGSLFISSQGAPALILGTGKADFEAVLPNTLVLRNKSSKLIDWSDSNTHRVSILSSFINYWEVPCDLTVLGSFDDSPLQRWRKRNGKDLSVEISAGSSSTTAVMSNYADEDYGSAPTKESLKLQSARLLTAGKMKLTLEDVMDTAQYITGETQPNATLRAGYINADGNTRVAFGNANSGGAFEIKLQESDFPLIDSRVEVISRSGYKNVIEDTTVIRSEDQILMFIHVPSNMLFPKTKINLKRQLISRADDNWHIVISDTRSQGSEWGLYARLLSPMNGNRGGKTHVIQSAVVYFDSGGAKKIMDESPLKVAEGIKSGKVESLVGWPSDKGICLEVDTLNVYTNIKYSARLEWILVDGP